MPPKKKGLRNTQRRRQRAATKDKYVVVKTTINSLLRPHFQPAQADQIKRKLTQQSMDDGIFAALMTRFLNYLLLQSNDMSEDEEQFIKKTVTTSEGLQTLSTLFITSPNRATQRNRARQKVLANRHIKAAFHDFKRTMGQFELYEPLDSNSRNRLVTTISTNISNHISLNSYKFLVQHYKSLHDLNKKTYVGPNELRGFYNSGDFNLHGFDVSKILNVRSSADSLFDPARKKRHILPINKPKSIYVNIDSTTWRVMLNKLNCPMVDFSQLYTGLKAKTGARLINKNFKVQLIQTDGFSVSIFFKKEIPIGQEQEEEDDPDKFQDSLNGLSISYERVSGIGFSDQIQRKDLFLNAIRSDIQDCIGVDPGKKTHMCSAYYNKQTNRFVQKDFTSQCYNQHSRLRKVKILKKRQAARRKSLYKSIKTTKVSDAQEFTKHLRSLKPNRMRRLAKDSSSRRRSKFTYHRYSTQYFHKTANYFRGKVVAFGACTFGQVKGKYPIMARTRYIEAIRRVAKAFIYIDEFRTTKLCCCCGKKLKSGKQWITDEDGQTTKKSIRDIKHCIGPCANSLTVSPYTLVIQAGHVYTTERRVRTWNRDFNAAINILLKFFGVRDQWKRD